MVVLACCYVVSVSPFRHLLLVSFSHSQARSPPPILASSLLSSHVRADCTHMHTHSFTCLRRSTLFALTPGCAAQVAEAQRQLAEVPMQLDTAASPERVRADLAKLEAELASVEADLEVRRHAHRANACAEGTCAHSHTHNSPSADFVWFRRSIPLRGTNKHAGGVSRVLSCVCAGGRGARR